MEKIMFEELIHCNYVKSRKQYLKEVKRLKKFELWFEVITIFVIAVLCLFVINGVVNVC